MIKNLLVPLDGSKASESVLPIVKRLMMSRMKPEVRLLRVVPPGDGVKALEEARRYLNRLASRLRGPSGRPRVLAKAGRAAPTILREAAKGGVDLIVAAVRANTPPKRLLLGSTTREVLEKSPVPMLLSPAGRKASARRRPLRRFVMSHDGTRFSQDVLPFVADLARTAGGRVSLVNVVNGKELRPPRVAAANVERSRNLLDRTGVSGDFLIHRARNPVDGILEFARLQDADLIALATRGKKGHVVPRGVADALLKDGRYPLLVVQPGRPVPRTATRGPKLGRRATRARRRTVRRSLAEPGRGMSDPFAG